ncbi:MAG: PqqD family peptide modification chaperone [Acidimicrobiales bacterium]
MRHTATVAPRPNRLVVEAPLGAELALFHLDSRRLHILNGSAAAIWRRLGEAETIGDLAVGLGDEFGVSPADIRLDVERTVEQLRADGLLQADERGNLPATPPRRRDRDHSGDVSGLACFAALDARLGIVCPDAEIASAIEDALAPLRCDRSPDVVLVIEPGPGDTWTLTVGTGSPATLGSRLSVVLRALAEVNALAVASVPDHLVLHAGAVAHDGRGVLLPGGSNHGKSTLTTALLGAGFGYLTDEAAAITDQLRIRPFPKSIALDPGSFPLFPDLAPDPQDGVARALAGREWHVDPARVGELCGPVPISAVVCPQWRAGAATRVTPVAPVEALHLLLGDAFDFRVGGQGVFQRLVEIVAHVPVVRLGYSDTAEAVAAVGDTLAATMVGSAVTI